ncbi:GAF domain-containing sensor histidine kinase [uncultured Maribacter sp.]|uniref:GAF domain-containing sensor histidine kinase n=1 Tax=uncultured Maribacter sp. TaxID=431308 RepID=UPI00262795CB|nr:GAF domain-containing sensor histidine kinase [uncultured Maribacter sp.]
MITAPNYVNEEERLKTLRSYKILDTPNEVQYDSLTQIAAEICETPISFINFVDKDRVWSKSNYGLEVTEAPRADTFCTHVIDFKNGAFVIPDATKDKRFKNNPFVLNFPNIIFYASYPITNKKGITIGNLCVVDTIPRELTKTQLNLIKVLANQAMNLLECHKNKEKNKVLEEKNKELEKFAYVAAHDLKSPLNNIYSLSCILADMYTDKLGKEGVTIVNHIISSSNNLKKLINDVLDYSKDSSILKNSCSDINILNLQNELVDLFCIDKSISLKIESDLTSIHTNYTALNQILQNLIDNAIKYNDKDTVKIKIGVNEDKEKYHFYVKDNGPGITPSKQQKIFNIFQTATSKDKYGNSGHGIGLATVKKLIQQMDGEISLESTKEIGSKFVFSFNKILK